MGRCVIAESWPKFRTFCEWEPQRPGTSLFERKYFLLYFKYLPRRGVLMKGRLFNAKCNHRFNLTWYINFNSWLIKFYGPRGDKS